MRARVVEMLKGDPELTAKRIGRLLEPHGAMPKERALREYVAECREQLFKPEAFVHQTHPMGATSEFDFGESRARVRGKICGVKYLLGTLPASNVYFAKAYARHTSSKSFASLW